MSAVAEQTGEWLAAFSRQSSAAPWLQELRRSAFQRFSDVGFPTTHDEEWRFTNVAPIARCSFSPLPTPIGFRGVPDGVETPRPEKAAPYLARLASCDRNPFVALNTAFLKDFVFLWIPAGTIVAEPIRLEFLLSGGAKPSVTHPRVLVVAGENAHCTIVESYVGGGSYFTNAVTEIVAGDGSVIDHYKLQRESLKAFHVATLQAQVGRGASFSTHNISFGAALTRNDVGAELAEGAEATLNGLYIAAGSQHVDNHTVIDHAKPHGTSHELYKGILDGHAAGVFNGRIIVRKDAQKTDSKQTNKNLVLSDDAVIDTKPELQIFADDVRCTHGATIGQLDPEALFYLQSRGIGSLDARALLTYAFAQDVVDRIKVKTLRDSLERVLYEKFHEHDSH
jgi:Fe-S cluster assembly protein SufD